MVRVAAKAMDVLLNPSEQEALVEQTGIEVTVRSDVLAGQETPETDAVVEVDVDEVLVRRGDEAGAVPVGISVLGVAAALNEDHDGQFHICRGIGGRPDVDEETVLVDSVVESIRDAYTNGSELFRKASMRGSCYTDETNPPLLQEDSVDLNSPSWPAEYLPPSQARLVPAISDLQREVRRTAYRGTDLYRSRDNYRGSSRSPSR
jgi:hypothetical protein